MTLLALTLASLAIGQTSQPDAGRESKPTSRRVAPRPAPLRELSPNERDQMQVDRWVQRASRTYRLDSNQEAMVRNELESFRIERRVNMGADALEYDRLRKDLVQFWNEPANTSEDPKARREMWRRLREDPKLQEIRRRMREIDAKYPFDWASSVERVEKILPAELVQQAHDHQNERADAAAVRRQASNPFAPPILPVKPRTVGDIKGTNGNKQPAVSDPQPLHPWEKYTRDFIRVNRLNEAQSNAALSILRDVRVRAEQMDHANANRVAAANQMPDKIAREKRLSEINQSIEHLFDELKSRLDGLLTAAQRAAKERGSRE